MLEIFCLFLLPIPNLNLSFDELTGTLSMTAEEIRNIALAEHERSEYEANVARLKELYVESEAVATELTTAQERLTEATSAYNEGIKTNSDDLFALNEQFYAAAVAVADLEGKQSELNTETQTLTESVNAYAESQGVSTQKVDETLAKLEEANVAYEYTAQVVNDALSQMEQKWQSYYESAKSSIDSVCGELDSLKTESSITSDEMMKNLQSQIDYWTEYDKNFSDLTSRAGGKYAEMALAIADGSTKSAGEIETLANTNDEELDRIYQKWAEANEKKDTIATAIADVNVAVDPEYQELMRMTDESIANMDQYDAAYANSSNTARGAIQGLNDSFAAYQAAVQAYIDAFNSIPDVPSSSGSDSKPSGYTAANGLSYVPYDNFPAILHEGERVLTKFEASAYRASQNITNNTGSSNTTSFGDIHIHVSGATGTKAGRDAAAELERQLRYRGVLLQ